MIVFFFRRYNDVDHIAPIAYRLLKDGVTDLRLLSLDPGYEFEKDFRLRFLKKECGARIDYAYRVGTVRIFSSLMGRLISGASKWNDWWARRMLKDPWKDRLFGVTWAKALLSRLNARVLVFDLAMSDRVHVYPAIRAAARLLGSKTVFIPNSLPVAFAKGDHAERVYASIRASGADLIAVPHELEAEKYLQFGFEERELSVLGSARFSEEWMQILDRLAPRVEMPAKTPGKLSVLYLERAPGRHTKTREGVRSTLEKIAALDFVTLVIKPHTRSNVLDLKELQSGAQIAQDLPTYHLMKWADVVIGAVSSALVDALILKKTLLYPRFFLEGDDFMGEPFFAKNASWPIESWSEMESALRSLASNPSVRPYTQESVDRFVEQFIYNSNPNRDVLGAYSSLLKRLN